jgi:hypothetical protein
MISSWLVKLAIGFVIVGVAVYDAGSMLVNFFTLDSRADEVALSLSTSIVNDELARTDQRGINQAAGELSKEANARLVWATVDSEGVVHVRLRRPADTLVVGRVGPVSDWTRATADARAGTS